MLRTRIFGRGCPDTSTLTRFALIHRTNPNFPSMMCCNLLVRSEFCCSTMLRFWLRTYSDLQKFVSPSL